MKEIKHSLLFLILEKHPTALSYINLLTLFVITERQIIISIIVVFVCCSQGPMNALVGGLVKVRVASRVRSRSGGRDKDRIRGLLLVLLLLLGISG